ncbi:PQQ-binding-like beta-propeller repeat protein [Halovenus sp. WSH3]|uniref:PQQ-binding-like beta-propeller repeat protein n=1 Tax=Halovenus carboxidivorans TaxID=2692199 RepID=A0A6B0T4R0_9EURY|nr:PQQ-binding-like beta-propeller repeat protein [Halovenus carboxidivorans]MXR50211.1 PQQ-binding-like beta-propeller repeat protein [Halovenus carboxidivorans]
MDGPTRREIEALSSVDAVGERLVDAPGLRRSSLTVHRVTFPDGTTGRAFTPTEAADRERFVRLSGEWEGVSEVPGITPVVARSAGETPWIVVRHAGDSLRAADWSTETTEGLLGRLAEALYRADSVHGSLTPGHVRLPSGTEPCLDWALSRPADTAPVAYLAPETRGSERDPDARTDVYGLGAIAHYLLTGEPPGADVGLSRLDGRCDGIASLCRRALAPRPADRHRSPYEFKQDLLFAGATRRPRTGPAASGSAPDASGEEPDTAGERRSWRPTRRQLLGAGGAAVAGVGLGARYLGTAARSGGAEPPLFETTYVSGLLVIRYTGEGAVDPSAVTISGRGIGAGRSTELSWADIRPGTAVEAGATVSLAADPAYRIDIETPTERVTAAGPTAEERVPDPAQLPAPSLPFEFTHRGGAVRIRPAFDAPARADHVRLTTREGGRTRRWRWHELAGTAPSRPLPESGPLAYPAPETVVLSLAWAPPYFERERLLTQYTGPGRPKSAIGGVRYPQYDRQNTGYEPSFSALSAPELAWEAQLPTEPVGFGSLAVGDGRVIVSGRQQIYCLDAVDGERLWRTTVDANGLFQPILWNDFVFAGSVDGSGGAAAVALALSDGSIRWQFRIGYQVMWPPFPVGDRLVTGGTGLTNPGLYWLDPEDGSRQAVVPDRAQQSLPATDGETVYLTGADGLYALTPNGSAWAFEQPVRGQPTLVGDSVFVFTNPQSDTPEMSVTELAAADGSVRWQSEPFPTRGIPALAATSESIFVGGARAVRALALGGGTRWTAETGAITGGPLVAGDQLHVTTTDGQLHALDRQTGRNRWTVSYGEQLLAPAVTDELAVLRRNSGPVAGFR